MENKEMSESIEQNMPSRLYFVGAGGIGMANLVRFYLQNGADVAGYDRTPSLLTEHLEKEGALLTFKDSADEIPEEWRNPEDTLVVYTPAVPETNSILSYFRNNGFEVVKRAALLGRITRHTKAICVAGSHGKTTTSSMIANILRESELGCNAFLGGVLRNIDSNLVLSPESEISVVEADEYDRSFHHLRPNIAVVTSTDPDHLDIYGDEAGYLEGFAHFTELINPGGTLILHTGLKLVPRTGKDVRTVFYSGGSEGDWHSENIRYDDGRLLFDIVGPDFELRDISLGVPVEINVDNAVAAAAACHEAGASDGDIRRGIETFMGARRRFQIWLDGKTNSDRHVLIDDYAHSPNEVKASINSVKKLYPGKKLTVIFQPHLYTRTRDFAPEFAEALSNADEVIMPEIYPARELPIPGVDSQLILKDVKSGEKCFCARKDLLNHIKNSNFEILMTLGAADIDTMLPDIERLLREKESPLK